MQKIIFNSKVYIIHKLGGYTEIEYDIHSINISKKAFDKAFKQGFKTGITHLAKQLNILSEELYGCSKQEWINKMYSEIQSNL